MRDTNDQQNNEEEEESKNMHSHTWDTQTTIEFYSQPISFHFIFYLMRFYTKNTKSNEFTFGLVGWSCTVFFLVVVVVLC